ncbi:hypothetical protein EV426DRAFT_575662 [Tirmania nivea]|nr:hypothetical protein EV426DRAFT_575662 [Tirmania nivea]
MSMTAATRVSCIFTASRGALKTPWAELANDYPDSRRDIFRAGHHRRKMHRHTHGPRLFAQVPLNSRVSKRSSSTILADEIFSIGDSFKAYTTDIALSDDVSHLASDSDVLSVELDRVVRKVDDFGEPSKPADEKALVTQTLLSNWGMGIISHRAAGATKYVYDSTAGKGTIAYIFDTGVYLQHNNLKEEQTTQGILYLGDLPPMYSSSYL